MRSNEWQVFDIHAGSASGDFAALLQAVKLSLSIGLGLAHHVVVIVGLASCADKERGREEGSGTGTDFLDLGNVVGQRCGVDQRVLVESARVSGLNRGRRIESGPWLTGRHGG